MSRAKYIWVVFDADQVLKACFTVKYEMVIFLERQETVAGWLVYRMRHSLTDQEPFRLRMPAEDFV